MAWGVISAITAFSEGYPTVAIGPVAAAITGAALCGFTALLVTRLIRLYQRAARAPHGHPGRIVAMHVLFAVAILVAMLGGLWVGWVFIWDMALAPELTPDQLAGDAEYVLTVAGPVLLTIPLIAAAAFVTPSRPRSIAATAVGENRAPVDAA